MPNELRLQKLVVDAVNGVGGLAFKMANKFIVGVPDLFIQLPGRGAGLWEVKSKDMVSIGKALLTVTVTPMQERFLQKMHDANGICGVISFVETPKQVYVAVLPWDVISYGDYILPKFSVSLLAYVPLERGKREGIIMEQLERAYAE